MFALFIRKSCISFYIFLVFLFSCNKNYPVFAIAYSNTLNTKNYLAYVAKINARQPVKIACEGTSLTYGQNQPGVLPGINGAGQQRALYQYPSALQITLQSEGINANVINRSFPGDRTIEGLTRWRDSTVADVCILEYGTNDAFNFGGYPSGSLTIPAFTDSLSKIVKRRLEQGAWVIITSPPDLNPPNLILDNYKAAILAVAKNYDLRVFDVEKSVVTGSSDYFDGVHLTALAYQKWGIDIAPLLNYPHIIFF